MTIKEYNTWRQNIALEYVCRTGRTYPRFCGPHVFILADMSNEDVVPEPAEVVDILIEKGYLHK